MDPLTVLYAVEKSMLKRGSAGLPFDSISVRVTVVAVLVFESPEHVNEAQLLSFRKLMLRKFEFKKKDGTVKTIPKVMWNFVYTAH